jgi:penicillin-binding protein 1A
VASLLVFLFFSAVFGSFYIYSVYKSLEPRVAKLQQLGTDINRDPTIVFSAEGIELARLAQERRDPITWPELPQRVIDATIAAEDRRFMKHVGVDPVAIVRALWINFTSGATRQGGSTITQQLAKRLLTSGERTVKRKIEDACLAVIIEREFTKQQILTMYVNHVFYGSGAYGVKAAADVYFGKDIHELSIAEVALLARLPRRPSSENPYVDIDAARENRNVVLDIMKDEGLISAQQHDSAIKEPAEAGTGDRHSLCAVLHDLHSRPAEERVPRRRFCSRRVSGLHDAQHGRAEAR